MAVPAMLAMLKFGKFGFAKSPHRKHGLNNIMRHKCNQLR